jgi:N-acetylmuramoyl-L-alanine amidase
MVAPSCRPVRRPLPFSRGAAAWLLPLVLSALAVHSALAYGGPQGFNTVVIDAGHGGIDRGGGPGQYLPEKPYTLDTAQRLERALRQRGFRTVMTRRGDYFVTLRDRVAIANSYRNAIFVSVHYNSAPRAGAHGFETYFYRSDSYGLAARLHQAQLSTLRTEDRRVRRRGFYVIRNTAIPSVLCEGGFLTSPEESRIILSASYRQRWAENIADAIAAQSRQGNSGGYISEQPAISLPAPSAPIARSYSSSRGRSSYSSRGSRGRSSVRSRGRSRSSVRSSRSSRGRSSVSKRSASKRGSATSSRSKKKSSRRR